MIPFRQNSLRTSQHLRNAPIFQDASGIPHFITVHSSNSAFLPLLDSIFMGGGLEHMNNA